MPEKITGILPQSVGQWISMILITLTAGGGGIAVGAQGVSQAQFDRHVSISRDRHDNSEIDRKDMSSRLSAVERDTIGNHELIMGVNPLLLEIKEDIGIIKGALKIGDID